jgi:hypothetical protein
MIRKIVRAAFALVLILPALVAAQEGTPIDKSRVPAVADSPAKFAPSGWKIEEQVAGDLNGDGVADYALKLVEDKPATDSEGTATERERALVVVLQTGGKLIRAALADKLLQCTRCGGAFYGVSESPANVAIDKGVIVVDQDHGSRNLTNTTYRFRYDQATKKFVLIGFDFADADRLTANVISESTNYVTGVRITTRGKGERDIKKRSVVPKKKTSLEDVDAGKMEQDAVSRLGLG